MWYDNPELVWVFGSFLVHEEGYDGPALLAFFEKPWKWQTEYDEWIMSLSATL